FDVFRREYNFERPHEALGQRPPGRFYGRSARRYPRKHVVLERDPWFHYARVNRNGAFIWDGRRIFLSTALAHETVELRATLEDDVHDIYFHDVLLGRLVCDRAGWRIVQSRRRKARPKQKERTKISPRKPFRKKM